MHAKKSKNKNFLPKMIKNQFFFSFKFFELFSTSDQLATKINNDHKATDI
jgi:hypothetical protein